MILVRVLNSIVVVYLAYSLIEYVLHRFLQHHRIFRPDLEEVREAMDHDQGVLNRNFATFTTRHYVHHARTSNQRRDYEFFDRHLVFGMMVMQLASVFASFHLLPAMHTWFSLPAMATTASVGALLSTMYYGAVHHLVHDEPWFEQVVGRYPALRGYLRHIRGAHLDHHDHPTRNFNFLYPGIDFILGTSARPER